MHEANSDIMRSVLFNIEPIGLGTGLVESLSSYLIRVAYEHNVAVGTLFSKMIFPKMNNNYLQRTSVYGGNRFYEKGKTINGYMENAIELARIMEELTSRDDLPDLTLYKLKEFIPLRNLLKDSFAWCPDCIRNWEKDGEIIYYPLIWHLKPVQICMNHKRFLIDRCSYCTKKVDIIRRQVIPGYCPNCFSILSKDIGDKEVTQPELNWQLFFCENIESLLSINHNKINFKELKRAFSTKLNLINEEYFSSSVADFTR